MFYSRRLGASPPSSSHGARRPFGQQRQLRSTPTNRFAHSALLRVNKYNPCPICGRTKWCSVREDGAFAVCTKVSDDCYKVGRGGTYIHLLNGAPRTAPSTNPVKPIGESGRRGNAKNETAPPEMLNEVYTALLRDVLTLRSEHSQHLMDDRGIGDTTILTNLYASTPLPSELERVSEKMREVFGERLAGVPGFYRDEDGLWQLQSMNCGFLIPYRNREGEIVGLQLRQDRNRTPKYYWVSSKEFPGGASPGSPLHFAAPHLVGESGSVVITEGALKADIISELGGYGCVAVAGVNHNIGDQIASALRQTFPDLAKVAVALDSDWKTNANVKGAVIELATNLDNQRRWQVEVWHWDIAHGKGLDDIFFNINNKGETTN
jgi:hypothetical protein